MKLTIISGRSGSGKSTVLHILEDRGYYCIDNLPASLLPSLADRISNDDTHLPNVAVSIDARNISADLQQAPEIISELQSRELPTEIIFLDANSQTLLRRFSESRRKHPLSNESTDLCKAIDIESALLKSISMMANLVIDTSNMSLHQLRDLVKNRLLENNGSRMALLFQSFGFKNGVPVDADLVYDARCLPNPYWDIALRSLTGLHVDVAKFFDSQEEVQEMADDITDYLEKWLPKYESNNRSYITVAVGCTGGQHRSVYIGEKLKKYFSAKIKNVQIRHRDLG